MESSTIAQTTTERFSAQVLSNGIPQKLYRRPWDGKFFVVGTPNLSYSLEVSNNSDRRIEVITTIDGRHVLKDEPGDVHRCRGLVIEPRTKYEFRGWRLNDADSNAFVFSGVPEAIATQATGSASNVGVIGFAVHFERTPRDTPRAPMLRGGGLHAAENYARLLSEPPATRGGLESMDGGLEAIGFEPSIGTGMGESQHDPVGHTMFTRDGKEPQTLAIGYDTEQNLRARGIIVPPEPNPFPGKDTGYSAYRSV